MSSGFLLGLHIDNLLANHTQPVALNPPGRAQTEAAREGGLFTDEWSNMIQPLFIVCPQQGFWEGVSISSYGLCVSRSTNELSTHRGWSAAISQRPILFPSLSWGQAKGGEDAECYAQMVAWSRVCHSLMIQWSCRTLPVHSLCLEGHLHVVRCKWTVLGFRIVWFDE